jgi:DNA invertase Pin-like site-specific DNA recombinase
MDNRMVAVYFRSGSNSNGFILPEEREAFNKIFNPDIITDEKEKAWVYCRSATGENDALQEQRSASLLYAADHNFEVVGESSDIGSGLQYDHAGLTEMLTAVRNGMVSAVIVRDISRIGRDYIKTHNIIENDIEGYGVELRCYAH